MRNSWILTLVLTVAAASLLAPAPLLAQTRGPGPGINPAARPAFSPYLNLLRRGNDPALNYYGLVRPELAANSAIQQLQQQQSYLAGQEQALRQAAEGPLPTGHVTGFQTQHRYFMTNRVGR